MFRDCDPAASFDGFLAEAGTRRSLSAAAPEYACECTPGAAIFEYTWQWRCAACGSLSKPIWGAPSILNRLQRWPPFPVSLCAGLQAVRRHDAACLCSGATRCEGSKSFRACGPLAVPNRHCGWLCRSESSYAPLSSGGRHIARPIPQVSDLAFPFHQVAPERCHIGSKALALEQKRPCLSKLSAKRPWSYGQ